MACDLHLGPTSFFLGPRLEPAMQRNPFAFLFSGFLLLLLLVGVTVGTKEVQRRNRLSYRVRHRVHRIKTLLGLS